MLKIKSFIQIQSLTGLQLSQFLESVDKICGICFSPNFSMILAKIYFFLLKWARHRMLMPKNLCKAYRVASKIKYSMMRPILFKDSLTTNIQLFVWVLQLVGTVLEQVCMNVRIARDFQWWWANQSTLVSSSVYRSFMVIT